MDALGRNAWFGPATGLTPNRVRRRRAMRLGGIGLPAILAAILVHAGVPTLAAGTRADDGAAIRAADGAASPAGNASPSAVAVASMAPVASRTSTTSAASWQAAPWLKPIDGLMGPSAPGVVLGGPARLVYRVSTTRKVVALTFDDGWNPTAGRLILDTLVREHVAATFFVNAIYLHRNPALWRDIAAAGFPIGNHTYDHADLTTLTVSAMVADIERDAAVFQQLTGQPMVRLLRPPYGARNPTVDAAARAAGYPSEILWNVVSGDTLASRSDASLTAAAAAGGPGSIVLMHVGPASTPRILAAVIARYRARGFTFVTIPQLLTLGR
jgi:peptidoglycan/xylan/chitin deacetylase (PgdA/CDA1 family)